MYRVILGIMYRRNLQLKDAFTSFVAAVQCTDVEVEKDALPTSVVDVCNVLYCIVLHCIGIDIVLDVDTSTPSVLPLISLPHNQINSPR
eukprot:scaffold167_cov191-Alexandrium_tamarense.AAC.12